MADRGWMVVFSHLRGRIWNPRIEFCVGHIIKVVGHAFHHTIFIGMTLDCDGYFCFRCRVEVLSTRRTSPECLKVADGESVWLPRPDRFAVAVALRSPDPAPSPWMNWTVRVLAGTVQQYDEIVGWLLPGNFRNRLLCGNGQNTHLTVSYPFPITYLGFLVRAAHCLVAHSLGGILSYLLRLPPQHQVQLSMPVIRSYPLKLSETKPSLSSSSSAPPNNMCLLVWVEIRTLLLIQPDFGVSSW